MAGIGLLNELSYKGAVDGSIYCARTRGTVCINVNDSHYGRGSFRFDEFNVMPITDWTRQRVELKHYGMANSRLTGHMYDKGLTKIFNVLANGLIPHYRMPLFDRRSIIVPYGLQYLQKLRQLYMLDYSVERQLAAFRTIVPYLDGAVETKFFVLDTSTVRQILQLNSCEDQHSFRRIILYLVSKILCQSLQTKK